MITLNEIKTLIDTLIHKDEDVICAENLFKKEKEEARKLREEVIPCALQELGLTKIVLESGETITLSQEVYASIPSDKKHQAFNWLESNGFDGLIKVDVVTSFSKGQHKDAQAFTQELYKKGLCAKLNQTVHPQTLKAFIKEQLGKGSDIPLDYFGANPVFKVKIKK